MSDKFNQKEEETFRKDLMRRMDNQDSVLKDIKIQTTATNGRVSKLEDWSNESKKVIESTTKIASDTALNYTVDKTRIWAVIGVLILLGGTIITLAIMAIDSKIQKGIDTRSENIAGQVLSQIEEKYDLKVNN